MWEHSFRIFATENVGSHAFSDVGPHGIQVGSAASALDRFLRASEHREIGAAGRNFLEAVLVQTRWALDENIHRRTVF